jgi:hypothetical protein
MNEKSILLLSRLPARLDMNQTAEILGFLPYEVSFLVSIGLLKPLGRPARNGHKYLCADEIVELSHDHAWLDRATRLLASHWQARNRA